MIEKIRQFLHIFVDLFILIGIMVVIYYIRK